MGAVGWVQCASVDGVLHTYRLIKLEFCISYLCNIEIKKYIQRKSIRGYVLQYSHCEEIRDSTILWQEDSAERSVCHIVHIVVDGEIWRYEEKKDIVRLT